MKNLQSCIDAAESCADKAYYTSLGVRLTSDQNDATPKLWREIAADWAAMVVGS